MTSASTVARVRPGAPVSTYRVQLTPSYGFAALAELAPYLARLGVTHAYLSPVLQAAPGSTHGYDVVDHGHVNTELGGEQGLRDAATALAEHGIGIVLDVVPNHMAVPVPERLNHAFWSLLRDGQHSAYARWFDVETADAQPVLLPILGERIDQVLAAGELTVGVQEGSDGDPVLRYYEHELPLRPGTEDLPLPELLEAQNYRMAYWRVGHEELNYRRFFDVDSLVAIRVEDKVVFDASHALIARLAREGIVQGLRIDHPDGLAEPRQYLEWLTAAATGDDGAPWVVVEKILAPDEELPADWVCSGTTGYDALGAVGGLFVDPASADVLVPAFAEITGDARGWEEASDQARADVLSTVLTAEVDRLSAVAHAICQSTLELRDYSRRGLTEGLVALLQSMDVYRAYVVPGEEPPAEAVQVLQRASSIAAERFPERAAEVALLTELALGAYGRSPERDEFVVRFQQTSGPVAAKGVEDTAGYRWFPLVSLAEVGAGPDRFGVSPEDLLVWARGREEHWPYAMNALTTHDTKRSEDVRARLAALSEVPHEYLEALTGWRQGVGPLLVPAAPATFIEIELPDEPLIGPLVGEPQAGGPPAPELAAGAHLPADEQADGRTEWLLWQTLLGAWPIDADRLTAFAVKAVREAKLFTSWIVQDEAYESAVEAWIRRVLADDDVMSSVRDFVQRLQPGFAAASLGQRAVQLVLPGVPDVYAGCESLDLRLVDPDNRTPVDHKGLAVLLDAALESVPDPATALDAAKLRLTALGLRLRADRRELFGGSGDVDAVTATGDAARHVAGLVRGGEVAVVATRFALQLEAAGGWTDTRVVLPAGGWRELLTERSFVADGDGVRASELLGHWPVALLVREDV